MEIVDLDQINISPDVCRAWLEKVRETIDRILASGAKLNPEEIPDEQARLEDDDSLTIFVVLPNGEEVNLKVPPNHWEKRFSSN